MIRAIVLLSLVLLLGCESATRTIAEANARIALLANEDRQAWSDVADALPEQSAQGMARCDSIIEASGVIAETLPETTDKHDAWYDRLGQLLMRMSSALIWVSVVVLVVYIGMKTGVFSFIGAYLRIATPKESAAARMALDVLDESRPESVREFIAAKRAADPGFNLAYEREKRRRQRSAPRLQSQANKETPS